MMNWADERYVKAFTRDSVDWLSLSFDAQALFLMLLRKVDRAGVLELGRHGKRGAAIAIGHPRDWKRIEPALEELLTDGCLSMTSSGWLFIPNFQEAQECASSDKARQQKHRELRVATARAKSLGLVTNRDGRSQDVKKSHDRSRDVTPCLAKTMYRDMADAAFDEPSDVDGPLSGGPSLPAKPRVIFSTATKGGPKARRAKRTKTPSASPLAAVVKKKEFSLGEIPIDPTACVYDRARPGDAFAWFYAQRTERRPEAERIEFVPDGWESWHLALVEKYGGHVFECLVDGYLAASAFVKAQWMPETLMLESVYDRRVQEIRISLAEKKDAVF